MTTNIKGLRGELLVAERLIADGYEVYMPLTGKASCDLVAVRADICFRVQVKTTCQKARYGNAYVVDTSSVFSSRKGNRVKALDRNAFDILAVCVLCENWIVLLPKEAVPTTRRFSVRNGAVVKASTGKVA